MPIIPLPSLLAEESGQEKERSFAHAFRDVNKPRKKKRKEKGVNIVAASGPFPV